MKPEPKVFSKQNPCTKMELWNAFRGRRGWKRAVQIDAAHAIVGLNAPKNMLRNGYAERTVDGKGRDVYRLTDDGQDWLRRGFVNFLKRNPDRADEAIALPKAIKSEAGLA